MATVHTDDEEGLDLVVTDLAALLRLLARVANKAGHLRVALGVETSAPQSAVA